MTVLDTSAVPAFLAGERGADVVQSALEQGACCSTANWSEVAQKVGSLLLSYGLVIEPVTVSDGEWAARRWRRGEGLSLGDRLCLALAARFEEDVLTADRSWGDTKGVQQIR